MVRRVWQGLGLCEGIFRLAMLVAPIVKHSAVQLVGSRLGLGNDHRLTSLTKLCVVGGGADLQLGEGIRLGCNHRFTEDRLAVVCTVKLE